ncbi:MAG: sterol desaturase family protein, partial [Planctomycetes bacterium]|nr:sterol desaturase family protein [Planctomycetota bacterium]
MHDLGYFLLKKLIEIGWAAFWLFWLSVIFIPLERLFSLRPQKILRREVWVDVGYYFI